MGENGIIGYWPRLGDGKMDLNDLQNLIPGAIKDVGTGIATATGAVKAWNALQEWKRERSQGLALSIRSAFYTRDYLGIALVGEIRNTTGNTVQLTDWILELPVQKLALAGGPPRGGGLYPGAPWWPAPPMLIEARRLTVGAMFFYAPREWNNALPENPLQGRLRAAIFPDKVIESDVEIRGLPAITET